MCVRGLKPPDSRARRQKIISASNSKAGQRVLCFLPARKRELTKTTMVDEHVINRNRRCAKTEVRWTQRKAALHTQTRLLGPRLMVTPPEALTLEVGCGGPLSLVALCRAHRAGEMQSPFARFPVTGACGIGATETVARTLRAARGIATSALPESTPIIARDMVSRRGLLWIEIVWAVAQRSKCRLVVLAICRDRAARPSDGGGLLG